MNNGRAFANPNDQNVIALRAIKSPIVAMVHLSWNLMAVFYQSKMQSMTQSMINGSIHIAEIGIYYRRQYLYSTNGHWTFWWGGCWGLALVLAAVGALHWFWLLWGLALVLAAVWDLALVLAAVGIAAVGSGWYCLECFLNRNGI